MKDKPKTAIFLLNIPPARSFKVLTMCFGIASFNFQAVETMLANVVFPSRKDPSLLKQGPPTNPGVGIFDLE